MSLRLAAFLVGLLSASPALAAPIYCEAWAPLAGGWLSARVIPEHQAVKPMLSWFKGDQETGRVTLSYEGEPADLRVARISVIVDKSGARAAAKRLHRVGEGDLRAEIGGQQWRSYWMDRHRWADPYWTMSADVRSAEAPPAAGGLLRLTLLPGRQPRPLLSLDLATPGGSELAEATAGVLVRAKDGLKTGEGCVEEKVDVSAVI